MGARTFINFYKHLSGCRYYVGFGTWTGPTLFFAGQLVEEAYGIEADPAAFAKVESNLALNKDTPWASRVRLNHHAVGLGADPSDGTPVSLPMSSSEAGNSCSSLGAVQKCTKHKREDLETWTVDSYSIPYLLNKWNLPSTSSLFLKVDTEGFECQLVPSWLPWVQGIKGKGPKPTFFVAFHSSFSPCSEEQYHDVYKFASLFDVVREDCMDRENELWTCTLGEYLFSDMV